MTHTRKDVEKVVKSAEPGKRISHRSANDVFINGHHQGNHDVRVQLAQSAAHMGGNNLSMIGARLGQAHSTMSAERRMFRQQSPYMAGPTKIGADVSKTTN